MTTLYEHAGGEEGLHRLEDAFYAKVAQQNSHAKTASYIPCERCRAGTGRATMTTIVRIAVRSG